MTTCFLGVDIGTYSSKGVLVRPDGSLLAKHTVEHDLSLPRPGWVEHDAEGVWWHDFVACTRALLAESGIDASSIAAIGVSAISPAIVPLDAAGTPLRPAILYGIDTRATAQIAALHAALGGEAAFFARYGTQLSAQSVAPKLRWIRENEPDVFARTEQILSAEGYVVWKLTGESVLDIYDATAYAPLFDPAQRTWDPAFADLVAPVEWMARPTWTCALAGEIHAAAAAETGLRAGTPVITGTADAAAEAISAGMAAVGDLMIMYGSSIFFIARTDRLPRTARFWGTAFIEPQSYALAGGMSTAGSLTRWFRDTLGQPELAAEADGEGAAYGALAQLAANAPPGSNGLVALPYFAGERTPLNDPDARGAWFGMTLSTTRADLYRALLESVAYGIRHNLDAMREDGVVAQRVLAIGGGTRNLPWMQMVSDVTGIEQAIPAQQIGASYGDAMLAAVGVGHFSSVAEAVQAWVQARRVVRPNATTNARYAPYYELYRQLYAQTAPTMHALSQLARVSCIS